jgi:hypothetical protein
MMMGTFTLRAIIAHKLGVLRHLLGKRWAKPGAGLNKPSN